jgi:hypothetical protein
VTAHVLSKDNNRFIMNLHNKRHLFSSLRYAPRSLVVGAAVRPPLKSRLLRLIPIDVISKACMVKPCLDSEEDLTLRPFILQIINP